MASSKTGKVTHDETVATAEGSRQSACGVAGVSQATVRAAEQTYYRSALASARAQGVDPGPFIHALWTLGIRDPG